MLGLRFTIILEVAMVWGHNLSEWFLDSSNLWLDYILARRDLRSDASPRGRRVTPVQLLLTLPSSDVPVQILRGLSWMTNELLLVLVQEVKTRLMREFFHVAYTLIRGSHVVLYGQETWQDFSSLCWLRSGYFFGSEVATRSVTVFLRCLGSPLDSFVICWLSWLHISVLLLLLKGTIVLLVLFVIVKLARLFVRHHFL